MGAQLPEIREPDASPDITALYNDICTVLGTPFVNLIHRYLATIPGALQYAWSLGRDACLDGRIDAWVAATVRDAELGRIAAAGGTSLPEPAREAAARIVEAYNRANPRNLIIFSALRTILERGDLHPSSEPPPSFPTTGRAAPSSTIPPLPKLADLDAETRRLTDDLTRLQRLKGTGLVPSLYLHLATIPGAVAVAHATVAEPLRKGAVAEHAERVRTSAGAYAQQIVSARAAVPVTVYERRKEIAGAVASFTQGLIPSMVVIGDVLGRRFN